MNYPFYIIKNLQPLILSNLLCFCRTGIVERRYHNYDTSLVSAIHILKEVCYMTTSFLAIHFFYDSVIISREGLKRPTCQGHRLYFTTLVVMIHYNKRSVFNSRKIVECIFFEENHCSPALLKVLSYLFHRTSCNNFCSKSIVLMNKSTHRDTILSW